jgi:hypothetical protein
MCRRLASSGHELVSRGPRGVDTVARRAVGPFTTHLTFRRPDGSTAIWSSRAHRKHASRLSRVAPHNKRVWSAASS